MADVAKPDAKLHLKAAVVAGLVAGAVFMMMEMALVGLIEGSPWGPPRMIAAIGLGQDVLPPPPTFDLTVLITAMMIHFVLSIGLGLIWGLLFGRFAGILAIVLGAAFGLVIYVVNFYGMTTFFPWFAMARNWIGILSHVVFGLVLALTYAALKARLRSSNAVGDEGHTG